MGLEAANFIAGLDQSWPTGLDKLNKGDDHLRLLKHVLKGQFPGSGGDGYARAIVANEDEVDSTVGATGPLQPQITGNADAIAVLIAALEEAEKGVTLVGGIILYNGSFNDIPANWQLCDGTNGTPNMTNKMVRGTNTQGQILNTGGSDDAVNVQHNHGISDPGHSHTFPTYKEGSSDAGRTSQGSGTDVISNNPVTTVGTGIGINNSGVSGTGKNVPAHVVLAYIQRMS